MTGLPGRVGNMRARAEPPPIATLPTPPIPDADIAIDVQGLTKRFGALTVVDGLDLRVRRGRIHGFLGPNGSGKTTTIRMLCGLLTPDEGQGTCLGLDIRRDALAIRPQVGYMTQRFGLYEDLSVEENLEFIARIYGVRQRQKHINASLERHRLGPRRKQLAGNLSGGWKQRLALAACLLHEPRLLLLDEPTAGVDPQARREFWDEIHALAADGITILVSTHYMDEAERCHELAYIAYGRLLTHGSVDQVTAAVRLETWAIHGPDPARLAQLAQHLRGQPGIRAVAAFGSSLHVNTRDIESLDAALNAAPASATDATPLHKERIKPSLEDAFIDLMQDAREQQESRTA